MEGCDGLCHAKNQKYEPDVPCIFCNATAPRKVLVALPFPNPTMLMFTKDNDKNGMVFKTINDAAELSPTIRALMLILLLFMDSNTCVVLGLQVDAHVVKEEATFSTVP